MVLTLLRELRLSLRTKVNSCGVPIIFVKKKKTSFPSSKKILIHISLSIYIDIISAERPPASYTTAAKDVTTQASTP